MVKDDKVKVKILKETSRELGLTKIVISNLYIPFSCDYSKCPFPHLTCNLCQCKFGIKFIYDGKNLSIYV